MVYIDGKFMASFRNGASHCTIIIGWPFMKREESISH
jgi:hypothetical protein